MTAIAAAPRPTLRKCGTLRARCRLPFGEGSKTQLILSLVDVVPVRTDSILAAWRHLAGSSANRGLISKVAGARDVVALS